MVRGSLSATRKKPCLFHISFGRIQLWMLSKHSSFVDPCVAEARSTVANVIHQRIVGIFFLACTSASSLSLSRAITALKWLSAKPLMPWHFSNSAPSAFLFDMYRIFIYIYEVFEWKPTVEQLFCNIGDYTYYRSGCPATTYAKGADAPLQRNRTERMARYKITERRAWPTGSSNKTERMGHIEYRYNANWRMARYKEATYYTS